jgi:hypothetical protein
MAQWNGQTPSPEEMAQMINDAGASIFTSGIFYQQFGRADRNPSPPGVLDFERHRDGIWRMKAGQHDGFYTGSIR